MKQPQDFFNILKNNSKNVPFKISDEEKKEFFKEYNYDTDPLVNYPDNAILACCYYYYLKTIGMDETDLRGLFYPIDKNQQLYSNMDIYHAFSNVSRFKTDKLYWIRNWAYFIYSYSKSDMQMNKYYIPYNLVYKIINDENNTKKIIDVDKMFPPEFTSPSKNLWDTMIYRKNCLPKSNQLYSTYKNTKNESKKAKSFNDNDFFAKTFVGVFNNSGKEFISSSTKYFIKRFLPEVSYNIIENTHLITGDLKYILSSSKKSSIKSKIIHFVQTLAKDYITILNGIVDPPKNPDYYKKEFIHYAYGIFKVEYIFGFLTLINLLKTLALYDKTLTKEQMINIHLCPFVFERIVKSNPTFEGIQATNVLYSLDKSAWKDVIDQTKTVLSIAEHSFDTSFDFYLGDQAENLLERDINMRLRSYSDYTNTTFLPKSALSSDTSFYETIEDIIRFVTNIARPSSLTSTVNSAEYKEQNDKFNLYIKFLIDSIALNKEKYQVFLDFLEYRYSQSWLDDASYIWGND